MHPSRSFLKITLLALTSVLALMLVTGANAHDDSLPHGGKPPLHAQDIMRAFAEEHHHTESLSAQTITSCENGFAGSYPCSNVDLMAFLPLAQIGGGNGNDIWGWTDSTTGKEYAIMGLTNGTAFIDVSDPLNPVYLGHLPPPSGVLGSSWRDIKVYNDHVFIGSEALHSGMQIMDLAKLRNIPAPPVTFAQDALYNGFSSSHNIVINEDTGFAYAVGTENGNCSRGLHFIDIEALVNPVAAGCFSSDGYTHDAQCVIYTGPDTKHQNKEICFAYNEDTLTIVDVSDKAAPVQISRTGYTQSGYTHQGWLTEDQAYLLMDDESDETRLDVNTRTLMWDMSDLDNPVFMNHHEGISTSIDHNQYIKGDFSYQANYRSGLRILDISDIANANLLEAGYFDIYPSSDSANFNGAWSVYPFFQSGIVIVSGIEQGLFILQPNLGTPSDPPQVSIVNPTDGSTNLMGSIQIQIEATDTEDLPGTLDVDWNINGGAWLNTTYVGGLYVADWNSSSVLDGMQTINARAVDSALRSANDSVSVTNANGSPEFNIDSVALSITVGKGNRNTGYATVSVLDDMGDPVSEASVEGSFTGDWNGVRSGSTDANGHVTLNTPTVKGLSALQFCVESASKVGWVFNAAIGSLCGNTGGTDVGSLGGLVTDIDTGQPIASASVSTDSGQNASTDDTGSYTLSGVPVGERIISVSANGYEGQNQPATVITAMTTTVDFLLTPTPTGSTGALKGSVKNSSGGNLSGVLVEVENGSSATTNKGGKYTIQNVTAGTRTVTASKDGYLPQPQQVEISAGANVTQNFTLAVAP